jgi:DNA mismatch repair protein MutS
VGTAQGFQSILFDLSDGAGAADPVGEPDFFGDLNLDQVVAAATAGREEYDLAPLFYAPLRDVQAVHYRHEVVRDLQRQAVVEPIQQFAEGMRRVRMHLAQSAKLRYSLQQQRWFLDAADLYCGAVTALAEQLLRVRVTAQGVRGLRDYLAVYLESEHFQALASATRRLREQLATVKYCVHIRGPRVTVRHYADEADYGTDVEKTFSRFKQGAVKDYLVNLPEYADMDHVQAQVLDRVAMLYPEVFRGLAEYCARYHDFRDATIVRFDREVQFYLAYLAFMQRLSGSGLSFCLPEVSEHPGEILIDDGFDLALATALVAQKTPVVCNSVRLRGKERVVVVTGPNNGGKTTFARMFGQVPYLAGLGLPVPARRAVLFVPDRVFSNFEREESMATLRGKLDDELVRIRAVLDHATGRSVIVMNESFASTTLSDARFIGTEIVQRITELGSVAVYVTFVDELAALGDAVVSMVGGVVPDDPGHRTYRITRQPADGLAYAAALAAKYGLTYASLKGRICR